MKNAIAELIRKERKHRDKADKCLAAIKAIQAACDHPETIDDGHDQRNRYVKCTTCGKRF